MPSTLWIVLTFFMGAIVGRYFEKIIGFLQFMRKDLQRVQREAGRGLPDFRR